MQKINKISLIIPAYKQERTIIRDLTSLIKTLDGIQYEYELLVVVDGFIDKTYELVRKRNFENVKLFGYKDNCGKGFAIKYGVSHATGDVIGFIDSGMELDPNGISMLLNHMIWYDADVIVGSKLHPVSKVNYPPIRRVLSWGYRSLIRFLFGLRIRDTQVGLKLFKRKVALKVFPRLLVDRFAFDVESLAVAYSLGFTKIYEAPIKLTFKRGSTISSSNFWSVILDMLWDTLTIYYRLKIKKSYVNPPKSS